ncbi:hypothetical protein EV174_002958 [Coemansia sp. RSA 2320]|nr:hypothetical protein EV174_002958 [Coemansia sp. RSA 2320]
MSFAFDTALDTGLQPSLPRINHDLLDGAKIAAVVDTNYFIDDLSLIQSLSVLALREKLVIVVPWVVIKELNGLKSSNKISDGPGPRQTTVGALARTATRFLEENLGRQGSVLRCQKISEHVRKEADNDDKILDCCLYLVEQRRLPVVMLTRDRNLAIKARVNGCATCGDWADGAAGLIQSQQQATIVISDSEDYSMDIDMLDDSEVQVVEVKPPEFGYSTSYLSTSRNLPLAAPAQPAPVAKPLLPDGPSTPTLKRDAPVIIYLDDSPGSQKAIREPFGGPKTAIQVSSDVTLYIHNTLSCGLTSLLIERLEKGLGGTYASDWCRGLEKAFQHPPWTSATTVLTIVLYYWDSIFSEVFPRSFGALIRSTIPWVMKIECLSACPQVTHELPPDLRVAPFAYSSETSALEPADRESRQEIERKVETGRLIQVAKRLLAQCALVESPAQERRREQLVDDWVTWHKANC